MMNEESSCHLPLACVIRASFPSLKDPHSACGLLLHPAQGIILTHGSILVDLCSSNAPVLSKVEAGNVISSADLNKSSFTVLLDNSWKPVDLRVTQSLSRASEITDTNHNLYRQDNSFTSLKCKCLGAFRVGDFHNIVSKTMPTDTWSFANVLEDESILPSGGKNRNEDLDEPTKDASFQLLSYFVLLQCCSLVHSLNRNSSNLPKLLSERLITKEILTIGAEAEIISTPFGGLNPHVFFNSYSRGVISNVSGPNDCWILTDARCIPGSEGGPLFTVHQNGVRQLSGIVTASLCWKNKEWVGFSLACGIDSIKWALASHIKSSLSKLDWHKLETSQPSCQSNSLSLQKSITLSSNGQKSLSFLPYVVLIKVGRVWGSGFVIDSKKSLILTCSHVIKDAGPKDPPIFIRVYNSSRLFKASVVYRQTQTQSEEITPFDLAVLRCPEVIQQLPPMKALKIVPALIGQRVWVFGHAIFNTDLGLQPSVYAGVISKVVKVRDQDIMVQTTCAVHAGASGGPLLDNDGNLVGIVVCNTVDKGSNSTYPHINFSIPATTVWPPVLKYIKTSDPSSMSSFKVTDPLVKKLWALDTPLDSDFALKSKL